MEQHFALGLFLEKFLRNFFQMMLILGAVEEFVSFHPSCCNYFGGPEAYWMISLILRRILSMLSLLLRLSRVHICAFPASRLGLQGIGISPDCNPENKTTPCQLFNWALEPAEDDILDKIFEQGYADAAVWPQENPVEDLVRDDSSSIGSSLAL